MSEAPARRSRRGLASRFEGELHLLMLWALAVAQPVYDVLRRQGEFFVAHRATRGDLLFFVLLISFVLPLPLVALRAAAARLSAAAGRAVMLGLVLLFAAAIASQALASSMELETAWHVAMTAAFGVIAAVAYAEYAPVRLFASVLSPAAAIVPALFLLHPTMASFVRPRAEEVPVRNTIAGPTPPIVMVVFDQLPLTSLMREDGSIDRASLPGFAALADQATWFRNASTVGDLTAWAVPPLLTGVMPTPMRLPMAAHYPGSLFTLLGGTYHLEVVEPITQLCPERLCPSASVPGKVAAMASDAAFVYLYRILPSDLRSTLPPLTDNWKNVAAGQQWHERWIAERDADRRRAPAEFIGGISRTDPPASLYFLHVLLPHEPYFYVRSGQQFTGQRNIPGLGYARWTDDEWQVLQAYQRHLAQVQYVDAIVEKLVARLTSEGLYDRSLIVITSDHGVSFRPGRPFKGIDGVTLPDIAAVPLFIKAPGQRDGVVDDRNVQSIDVVPSIAELLHVGLPWTPEGQSIWRDGEVPATKTIYHAGGRQKITIDAREFARKRDEAVARKARLFEPSTPGQMVPAPAVVPGLVGRRVSELAVTPAGALQATVDGEHRFKTLDTAAPVLPAILSGRAQTRDGRPARARLAIALNGVIATTTQTDEFATGRATGRWRALVSPTAFRHGFNAIDVLAISGDGESRTFEMAYVSSHRPDDLNLASRSAVLEWAVEQSGLHELERGATGVPFRWTSGAAEVRVPLDSEVRSLRVGLAGGPKGGGHVRLAIDGCVLYDDVIRWAPWYRTFSLRQCPGAGSKGPYTRIEVRSPTVVPGGGDNRPLGVGIETLNLFSGEWPPEGQPAGPIRAALRVLGSDQAVSGGGPVRVEVSNRGASVWVPSAEAPRGTPGVALRLRWQSAGRTQSSDTPDQVLQLPRAVYPNEQVVVDVPLVPPRQLASRPGPWEVEIALVRGGQVPSDRAARCVVRVDREQHGTR